MQLGVLTSDSDEVCRDVLASGCLGMGAVLAEGLMSTGKMKGTRAWIWNLVGDEVGTYLP